MHATVPFEVNSMKATIPEGIDFTWKGCSINSGPIHVTLDDQARAEGDNRGELDYDSNKARARFNLKMEFPALAKGIIGSALPELTQPIRGVLQSEGLITEDHNFGLSGPLEVQEHPLVDPQEVSASILPGR